MRQGKGGAAAASSTPATPKSARKRVASSAPSTGKSTAGKKARVNTPKPVQAPLIDLDDDDDENEFPPISLNTPMRGPRFADKLAEQFFPNDTQTPTLDLTQAETPNDDEDFKPHTPIDVPAHSFSHTPLFSSGGYAPYATDQPSFTGGIADSKAWTTDDFDDEV